MKKKRTSKSTNRRFARKRALRTTTAMRDSIRAAGRNYGQGLGK